jgi:hypothetical protein
MINVTLLQTQVTPNDCGIRSGCSLQAPCLNSGLRRWLSRCLCLTRRGRWPDPLPSSCSLGWWRPLFVAECEESRSLAERSADKCSAPPPHLVVYHLHPGDIPFYPVGLELILLPIGQEVVDRAVIPRSEKEGTKPPYVCPGCSNHTYSNNIITRFHVQ